MADKEFKECPECRRFVYCDWGKVVFHKSTGVSCKEFEEDTVGACVRRLAELIGDASERAAELDVPAEEVNSFVAAWLLREGVLLPPVKIGQEVYAAIKYFDGDGESEIEPWAVAGYGYFDGKWHCCDEHGGGFFTVGGDCCKLTREEAEEVVKGWERDGSEEAD